MHNRVSGKMPLLTHRPATLMCFSNKIHFEMSFAKSNAMQSFFVAWMGIWLLGVGKQSRTERRFLLEFGCSKPKTHTHGWKENKERTTWRAKLLVIVMLQHFWNREWLESRKTEACHDWWFPWDLKCNAVLVVCSPVWLGLSSRWCEARCRGWPWCESVVAGGKLLIEAFQKFWHQLHHFKFVFWEIQHQIRSWRLTPWLILPPLFEQHTVIGHLLESKHLSVRSHFLFDCSVDEHVVIFPQSWICQQRCCFFVRQKQVLLALRKKTAACCTAAQMPKPIMLFAWLENLLEGIISINSFNGWLTSVVLCDWTQSMRKNVWSSFWSQLGSVVSLKRLGIVGSFSHRILSRVERTFVWENCKFSFHGCAL